MTQSSPNSEPVASTVGDSPPSSTGLGANARSRGGAYEKLSSTLLTATTAPSSSMSDTDTGSARPTPGGSGNVTRRPAEPPNVVSCTV